MSDLRVIFHVGWPKTATTSMQAELSRFPNLAGKPFGHPGTGRAIPTIDAIVRARTWSPDDLDSLVAASRNDGSLPVLLSDEVLIAMPQREWFEGLVGPFEVADRLCRAKGNKQVVFTLRNPRRQLRSTWLHHVREGRTQTYRQFVDRVSRDRAESRGTFAVAALIGRYSELFGPDGVAVGFTEDYTTDSTSFWQRFGDVLGIPRMTTFVDSDGARLNATVLGPISYELTVNRALQAYGRLRRRDDIRPLRRIMTRKVSRRIHASHEGYFQRHSEIEDLLVTELLSDIEHVKKMVRTI